MLSKKTASYVEYLCSCGSSWPLSRLYFCSHCTDLRCLRCLSHEAETFYCPSCIEPLPPSDARAHGCICSKCLLCPCCRNQLAVKANQPAVTTVASSSASSTTSSASVPRTFYLHCSVCLWSSRDAGIPDQNVLPQASHFFHSAEIETIGTSAPVTQEPDLAFSHTLIEAYRELGLVEKACAIALGKNKRKTGRKSGSQFRLNARQVSSLNVSVTMERFPVIPTGVPAPLSDDFIANPPQVRYNKPLPRQLAVRRGLRCPRCDHVICFPELRHGQHSRPWFRMSLGAASVLPTIKIDNMSAWPPAANLLFYHPSWAMSVVSTSATQAVSSGQSLRLRLEPSAPFELIIPSNTDTNSEVIVLEQPSEDDLSDNRDAAAEKSSVRVTVIANVEGSTREGQVQPLYLRIVSKNSGLKFLVRINFEDDAQ